MKKLKYYLKKAQNEAWAIGQFNFSTLEQLKAIVQAANKLNSPIILGTSENEAEFIGIKNIVALVAIHREKYNLPIFLNLDHGKSLSYIKKVIDVGYDAVHFDGSKLSFEDNILTTKKVVSYARERGVFVEAELGIIPTDSSKIYKKSFKIEKENLTIPREAKEFIKQTSIGSLAISMGSFHGIQSKGLNPKLDFDRLRDIRKEIGEATFLVLHGGSGISDKDIKESIRLGIRKININTELRVAYTKTLREELKKDINEIIPYKYLLEPTRKVQKRVEEKIKLFKSNNKYKI